jgi:hypothetical protein
MKQVQRPDIESAAGQVDTAGRLGKNSHAQLYYTAPDIENSPGFR